MDKVPIIFKVDRRDVTGYGLAISKELGAPYFILEKVDPYESRTIRLDFHQLLGLMKDIVIAEMKEKNKRISLRIGND